MKQIIRYIQQRLSLRLGLLIVLIIMVVFSLLFDFLFYRCKQLVRQVAIDKAVQLLDNTAERINGIMDETEIVTNYMATFTPQYLHPDSLLSFTHRTVANHSFLTGFAISMEPYYFPEMGRYYSAYSLRENDTISTVREGPFEYFEKIWYKSSRTKGVPCWVDAYDDYNEGTQSSKDILTSYCCPMRDAKGKFVGSITASLTLKWLSEAVSRIKPFPNSSAIMIGRTGTYLVHPDTAKLFRETIFSDAAPEAQRDINKLGKDMIAGHSGMMQTIVDGRNAYIFYRPLQRTGWSIAIVCPENDVFKRYNQLLATVWIIIGIGLLILLFVCYQTVRSAMQPIKQLAQQAQLIANGYFDESLPESQRSDSVGRLTNSFNQMQHSLAESVSDIQNVNKELELRYEELSHAYQMKVKDGERKVAFIQNMFHQIRTPLNIISGFTQVLSANFQELSKEEVEDITFRMMSSANTINHISRMLTTSAGIRREIGDMTTFSCNALCREVLSLVQLYAPDAVEKKFESEVPDTLTIHTDREALRSILDELLDNANKFTHEGYITINCRQEDANVIFSVSNTGTRIPADARDRIFTPFTKLSTFTEGIGLGLSLSRHTARQLGGDITYDATYETGTRFVVKIPINPSEGN
jgi:sigma-B regulation protein RsbU (phosphoserine phosphatase)